MITKNPQMKSLKNIEVNNFKEIFTTLIRLLKTFALFLFITKTINTTKATINVAKAISIVFSLSRKFRIHRIVL
jgi:hypothetical protein